MVVVVLGLVTKEKKFKVMFCFVFWGKTKEEGHDTGGLALSLRLVTAALLKTAAGFWVDFFELGFV